MNSSTNLYIRQNNSKFRFDGGICVVQMSRSPVAVLLLVDVEAERHAGLLVDDEVDFDLIEGQTATIEAFGAQRVGYLFVLSYTICSIVTGQIRIWRQKSYFVHVEHGLSNLGDAELVAYQRQLTPLELFFRIVYKQLPTTQQYDSQLNRRIIYMLLSFL